MRIPAPLFGLALLALLGPSAAGHCGGPGRSSAHLDTGPDAPVRYYFVNEATCHMCPLAVWAYEETNGIDGLQRDDDLKDDTCHGTFPGDTLVF